MAEKKRRKFNECPNCVYQFSGVNNYCPNCGQENHNLDVPFSHVVMEVLEGTLHFDTKIFRTLKLLLFKPGRLTELFIQNQRADFVPPIRLYVFISFIFFLVIAAVTSHKQADEKSKAGQDTFSVGTFNSNNSKRRDLATMSDAQLAAEIREYGFEATEFKKNFIRKAGRFSAGSQEEKNHKFYKSISLLMFVLMPLFGLIVQSVYFRRKKNYIQHLIFSVHFHCFAFIVFSIAFLLRNFTHLEGFGTAAFFISILYLLLALQYLFKQSWTRTALKTIYIASVYLVVLFFFIVLAAVLSVVFS